jgi:hypothetical protein
MIDDGLEQREISEDGLGIERKEWRRNGNREKGMEMNWKQRERSGDGLGQRERSEDGLEQRERSGDGMGIERKEWR